MVPIDTEALKIIEACQNHAKDLYRAAQTVRSGGLPNVAYHLATLALEEIGKAQLVGMRVMSKRDDPSSWYEKQLDDHIKKLFWALWGRVFSRRPDRSEMESLRNLATIIHENRLRGLYVSSNPAQFMTPKEAIREDSLEPLMVLVEARIVMEPQVLTKEYAPEDFALLQWFADATDDPEKRKFIFSSASFDKMESITPREWLHWLKTEIERVTTEALASLDKELKRVAPETEGAPLLFRPSQTAAKKDSENSAIAESLNGRDIELSTWSVRSTSRRIAS